VTPGVKTVYYKFDFTQFADNGKTVGSLNGAPSIEHSASFNAWQPSFDMNYKLRHKLVGLWSVRDRQLDSSIEGLGRQECRRIGIAKADADPDFSSRFGMEVRSRDARRGFLCHSLRECVRVLSGCGQRTGLLPEWNIEDEGTGSRKHRVSRRRPERLPEWNVNSAKYTSTGLWLANAPKNTQTVGLSYQQQNWDLGFFNKRIGSMWNDNGNVNEAVAIDPFNISNLYLNYTIKNQSEFSQTKIRLTINNLFDQHSIVGVKPAATTSNLPAANDQLTLLAARSVSLSLTLGFSPRH